MSDSLYLLQATGITKSYVQQRRWGHKSLVKALDDVSLALPRAKTVAVVGRSGSGKTTLAMCLALLEEPDSGDILFEDSNVVKLDRGHRRLIRRRVQLIFQHSASALSPRLTMTELVEEPLVVQRCLSPRERSQFVGDLLGQVGLGAEFHRRRPHELSGGQRQRVAIARSLALNPSLLILDEPFVGLDAPIRNQIVNLLVELQKALKLTYLYISHDLALVRYFADTTLVMDRGKLITSDAKHVCLN